MDNSNSMRVCQNILYYIHCVPRVTFTYQCWTLLNGSEKLYVQQHLDSYLDIPGKILYKIVCDVFSFWSAIQDKEGAAGFSSMANIPDSEMERQLNICIAYFLSILAQMNEESNFNTRTDDLAYFFLMLQKELSIYKKNVA